MKIVNVPGYGDPERAPALEDVLARPLFAHLATASPKGPRESPCWFIWENSSLWMIANSYDSFPRRIEFDARCSVGIVDFDVQAGLVQHVGMRGTAAVEAWDAARAKRLLSRYLGSRVEHWDRRFSSTLDAEGNRWIRFVPETVVIRDQSYATRVR